MMHPDTTCREVNDTIGLGVFATTNIPKGTIMNIESDLDIQIDKKRYAELSSVYQEYVDKYSYVGEEQVFRINWDHARYMNHCCFSNTLTTAYDFEIAIVDIRKGEQITCDYRLFNHKYPEMPLSCNQKNCLRSLKFTGLRQHIEDCDEKIKQALLEFFKVPQPLFKLLKEEIIEEINAYLRNNKNYDSLCNWVQHE